MCGIFGYIGSKNPVEISLQGLQNLEYRGYDSAGIAGIKDHQLISFKEVGKVSALKKLVEETNPKLEVAIAHTRWATHGKPSYLNAHPHFDEKNSLCLVHNGIIENYAELKAQLETDGVAFRSETDSEVMAHLIARDYQGDLLAAVQKSLKHVKGSFAFAIIHRDHPDQIITVSQGCPMVIGIGENEFFISSDAQACSSFTQRVIYLSKGEIAVVKSNGAEVYNDQHVLISKDIHEFSFTPDAITKGEFSHYTLKEIFEQPLTVQSAMDFRISHKHGTAVFDELTFSPDLLRQINRILILACGTSYHAGLIASYMIEEVARIPVETEISSEFRYKNPIVQSGTFVIAISQSGETADTLAAIQELKEKGAPILSLCNVLGATMTHESDATLFLNAGPEIGVCSTKAFTSQLVVLSLLCLHLARLREMSIPEGQKFLQDIEQLPMQVKAVLEKASEIEAIATKYSVYENFFFLGRKYMYPASLEAALKLKEISYLNANGYPAGEMKHGPIALIDEKTPTVALFGNKETNEKLFSNLMEVKARNGLVLAIAEEGERKIESIADAIIWVPKTRDELAPILFSVACQLLAYYIALARGCEIDQPRNLAKSVTVE